MEACSESPMGLTPDTELHRALCPLNWTRGPSQPVDGPITRKNVDGCQVLYVRAGSGQPKTSPGISFFDFYSNASKQVHAYLGVDKHTCGTTTPKTSIPDGLRFVCDGPTALPVISEDGETRKIEVGVLWSLYAAEEMEAAEFEKKYAELCPTFATCELPKGGAEQQPFEVDLDYLPGDRLTRVAVLALDELGDKTNNPNTRMFARIYAGHMRAVDMDFGDMLQHLPMAWMAAQALEDFGTSHPMLFADAYNAQCELSELFNDEDFKLRMPQRIGDVA
ncbi:hypothetical protein Agub_g6586 [Astrephomene gubernaculifera]|uniref:Uncharacterized protein n=1 Tax=Astrephomene gubernaculifera TaxID=47775 RepID=A0AAD3DNL2_9CHLO|nr:hypothetical protein Agub_g6586 [Astrephomene gubernaculifera]